jgi:FKBP-type peptidyl-prolyl cis-trans isomerase SlyD
MVKRSMVIAKNRVASFDYTLSGADKAILDSSEHTGPLVYLHGYENIIPGLENALEGKAEGDSFSVTVPAAEAYGEWDKNLVIAVPLDRFPGHAGVQEGMRFEAETSGGNCMVKVTRITETEALLDANHPMAGLDLGFDIRIRSVRDALPAEIEHGRPREAGCGDRNCGGCGTGRASADCVNAGCAGADCACGRNETEQV